MTPNLRWTGVIWGLAVTVVSVLAGISAAPDPWRVFLLRGAMVVLAITLAVAAYEVGRKKRDRDLDGRAQERADATLPPRPTAREAHVRAAYEHGSSAITFFRAADEMVTASIGTDARSVEAGLLETLRDSASQRTGIRRRASILRIDGDRPGQRQMRVIVGSPARSFPNPLPVFSEAEYGNDKIGLCWAALADCERANVSSIAAWVREYADLDGPHSPLKHIPGDNEFKTIMIAPIWRTRRAGRREPLGVVCLDSSERAFYQVTDQQLIVMAAAALAIGWSKWPPYSQAVTGT